MSAHVQEHEPLVEDPRAVGVPNYCSTCRDRVCLECRNTDDVTGGGSWQSGHCFNCQWIVSERRNREDRQRAIDYQREQRAEAWDEGYNVGWNGRHREESHGDHRNPYR